MSDPQTYIVGWPPENVHTILDRVKRGLPAFWPTDPQRIDQTVYREYVTKRSERDQ